VGLERFFLKKIKKIHEKKFHHERKLQQRLGNSKGNYNKDWATQNKNLECKYAVAMLSKMWTK
jgi:hypothetical protein